MGRAAVTTRSASAIAAVDAEPADTIRSPAATLSSFTTAEHDAVDIPVGQRRRHHAPGAVVEVGSETGPRPVATGGVDDDVHAEQVPGNLAGSLGGHEPSPVFAAATTRDQVIAIQVDLCRSSGGLPQQVMQDVGLSDVGYGDRVEAGTLQGQAIDLPADLAEAHQSDP